MNASQTYATWVREIVAKAHATAGINQLFDSSIEEPAELMREVLQSVDWSQTGHYRSTFPVGNPLVLARISESLGVDASRLLATAGATDGARIVAAALISPGDHVVVERPYFDMLVDGLQSLGADISYLDWDAATGTITPEALQAALRPETKLVLLVNPNNPTGFLLDQPARKALAAVAEAHQVPILFDEVYAGFQPGGRAAMLAANDSEWFVSVGSLSKLYGLYALKCGWIVAGGAVRARILATYQRLESSVSRSSHAIAARVFEEAERFDAHWQAVLAASRPVVEASMARLQAEGLLFAKLPACGCVMFPRLPDGWDDVAFSDYAFDHYAVAVAPGALFGWPGYLRIGFGRSADHVRDGLERLEAALRGYREMHA